jgi:hypothetical protein
MKKVMCAKCGGSMKKMSKGGQPNMTKTMPGYNATTSPITMKKGGAKKSNPFGMLSVIAGIDKNPKPTAADRIAGATKRKTAKKK